MADNGRSHDGLSGSAPEARVNERREFLRRATLLGLPLALVTVRPPTVWAQTTATPSANCALSLGPSGCGTNPSRWQTQQFGS